MTATVDPASRPLRPARRTPQRPRPLRRAGRSRTSPLAASRRSGLPWFLYPPVAVDILCWALFAVSVDLLLGYTGLLSFGHAAFWGTSAYVTGLVAIHAGGCRSRWRCWPGRWSRRCSRCRSATWR